MTPFDGILLYLQSNVSWQFQRLFVTSYSRINILTKTYLSVAKVCVSKSSIAEIYSENGKIPTTSIRCGRKSTKYFPEKFFVGLTAVVFFWCFTLWEGFWCSCWVCNVLTCRLLTISWSLEMLEYYCLSLSSSYTCHWPCWRPLCRPPYIWRRMNRFMFRHS